MCGVKGRKSEIKIQENACGNRQRETSAYFLSEWALACAPCQYATHCLVLCGLYWTLTSSKKHHKKLSQYHKYYSLPLLSLEMRSCPCCMSCLCSHISHTEVKINLEHLLKYQVQREMLCFSLHYIYLTVEAAGDVVDDTTVTSFLAAAIYFWWQENILTNTFSPRKFLLKYVQLSCVIKDVVMIALVTGTFKRGSPVGVCLKISTQEPLVSSIA